VALIPLLIKYPDQSVGTRDDSNVETIDILPTIRDVVGAKVHWEFDGYSLLDPDAPIREIKQIENDPLLEPTLFTISNDDYLAARRDALDRNIETFSLDDSRSDLFHFGVGLDLIGKPIASVKHKRVPATISCEQLDELREIDLNADYLPTSLTGKVEKCARNPEHLYLVVSMNGTIQHVTKLYLGIGKWTFDLMLSDSVFQQGKNDIELFLIDPDIP
jgi:hypothetical protein